MTERDGKELTATALRALGGEIRREGRSTYWQLPSGSTQRLDLDMTTGTEWPGWLLDQYRAAGYHFAVYASEEGWQVLDTTSGSGAYVAPEPSESLNIALLLAIERAGGEEVPDG